VIDFDPSAAGSSELGLFGIPTREHEARIVLIPVPWEVTTSYGGGTAHGPSSIREASAQVDLFDLELAKTYEVGYHLLDEPNDLRALNAELKPRAIALRDAPDAKALADINAGCRRMSEWVHARSVEILARGQIPAVLGGDHSSPEGIIRAVCERTGGPVGLLHIDAHADLREAYEGFTRSHASIMYNVMNAEARPAKLVQVGIRDFSEQEYELTQTREDIVTFFDAQLKREQFEGQPWASLCTRIVAQLPPDVYVSFDIDGLSPEYCPHTGTPVPGGLSFDQANYLVGAVVRSGRRIVGFDLNEVAPGDDEWDGNVGARLLFKLCGWAAKSHPAGPGEKS
jgi:agmatinase